MISQGLSSAEAAAQLNKFGLNEIIKAKKLSGLLDFLSRFKNPLLIILIVSAVISGILGDPVTAGIIIFIVLVSVLIDFINTYKSQKAAEDLKKRVMITTTVIRDGAEAYMVSESMDNCGLTAREKETLELAMDGFTTREIGKVMGISHVMVVKLKAKIRGKYSGVADGFMN